MDRHLRTMLGSTRPAFLLLPPVCVLLGAASVHWSGHRVDAVAAAWFPPGGLLAFLLLPLAVGVARGALRDADNLPALVSTMGRNVALTLLTPLALAVGGWVWP